MPARVDLHATPLSWFDHPTHRHRHFYHLLSSLPLASVYPLSSLLLHTFLLSYLSLSFFPVSSIIRTLFLSLSFLYLVLFVPCFYLSLSSVSSIIRTLFLSFSLSPRVSSIIRTLFLSLSLSLLAYLVLFCLSLSTRLCRARSIVLVVRRNPNRDIYIYIYSQRLGGLEQGSVSHRDGQRRVKHHRVSAARNVRSTSEIS